MAQRAQRILFNNAAKRVSLHVNKQYRRRCEIFELFCFTFHVSFGEAFEKEVKRQKNKAAEEKRTKNDMKEKQLAAKRISPTATQFSSRRGIAKTCLAFTLRPSSLKTHSAAVQRNILKTLLCNKK